MDSVGIGPLGEAIAEKFIVSRGYRVRERNFRTPLGEIDLICEYEDKVIFIEVKTRICERFGPPSAAITPEKAGKLIRLCELYMSRRDVRGRPCRIDVIAITLNEGKDLNILKHVRNAVTG